MDGSDDYPRADSMLAEFDSQVASLRRFCGDVEKLLARLLADRDIHVHEVGTRLKDHHSLARKLRRHDPPYASLDEVTDLVGARVITYFADDVDRVADLLEIEFEIDRANSVDKRALIEPDRFGYVSLHYICRLSASRGALPEWARFADQRFEIQVRSILQHAWAEIEHDLGYHVEQAVPAPVRRRFSRLAGLLEVADSEFRGLRGDVDAYRAQIAQSNAAEVAELPLDRDSLAAWIGNESLLADVEGQIATDIGRLAEDIDEDYISKRVEDFAWLGFTQIPALRAHYLSSTERVLRFAAGWKPKKADVEVPRGVSLWFLFLLTAADRAVGSDTVQLPPRYNFSPARVARLLAARAAADD